MTKDELRKHEIYLTNLQPNEFVSNKSFYGKAKSVGINGVGMFLIRYAPSKFKRGLSKKEWKSLAVEESPVNIDDIYALCGNTHYSIY